jgi:hypothetical protein
MKILIGLLTAHFAHQPLELIRMYLHIVHKAVFGFEIPLSLIDVWYTQ